jgi:hypothetical protein
MLTSARIGEDLETEEGVRWITAWKVPQIQQWAADGNLQIARLEAARLGGDSPPAYPGERWIACRNPLMGRRAET